MVFTGTTRKDLDTYLHRTEHIYGINVYLNYSDALTTAHQLIEIDKVIKSFIPKVKSSRVLGAREYTETSASGKSGMIDDKVTRVHLIVAEYWFNPEDVENTTFFKTLSQSIEGVKKFNI